MALRVTLSILLFLSAIFMPFWLSCTLLLIGVAYFKNYWEGVVMFFLSDLLYGVQREAFLNILFASGLLASLILFMAEFLKKKLKFYPNY